MRFIFWAAVGFVGYTYFGYVAWLWLRSRWRARPVQLGPDLPFVSIVLVVRNEAESLDSKLKSLLSIDYPADRAEILVVSDGSTDGTNQALSKFAELPRVRVILKQETRGKASGLNDGINAARGEVVVFTDARQTIEVSALRRLMENFRDPHVGCASGELILGDPIVGEPLRGMGLYWRIERTIRRLESATGSVAGATGAFYAVRRSLLAALPPETILDDVFIPMRVVQQGARVVLDPRARIWDAPDLGARREFGRKVRTLTGIYQLLELEPWLLSNDNPLLFEFVSHKLFRLAVPFASCAMLISSFFLHASIYQAALGLQLAFYSLSVWKPLPRKMYVLSRFADVAFTFVLLNAAALVAFGNFVAGRKPAWSR